MIRSGVKDYCVLILASCSGRARALRFRQQAATPKGLRLRLYTFLPPKAAVDPLPLRLGGSGLVP